MKEFLEHAELLLRLEIGKKKCYLLLLIKHTGNYSFDYRGWLKLDTRTTKLQNRNNFYLFRALFLYYYWENNRDSWIE